LKLHHGTFDARGVGGEETSLKLDRITTSYVLRSSMAVLAMHLDDESKPHNLLIIVKGKDLAGSG
jgi:hypothetical protein